MKSTLVLLPGLDGTGELFTPLLQALDRNIECIILRYPNDQPMSYGQLQSWVLEQLPQDTPYYLLAESFSGPLGFAIAAQDASHLKGIIFVATFLTPPRPLLTSLASALPWQILTRFKTPKWFSRKFLLGHNASKALITQLLQIVENLPPELIQFRLKQIAELTLPASTVSLPCLYLSGNQDYFVPTNNIESFNKLCSNLTIKSLDGPHFLLQAEPKKCGEYIKNFLLN